MSAMSRLWLAAALLCASAASAGAQSSQVEREVKAMPGKDVRVGVYAGIRADCTAGPLPTIRLVTPPSHGAVTVKRGTFRATNFKQCLATEVPAFVTFYRAAENFSGADEFVLEVTAGARKQLEHFRVTISTAPGAGQGI
jgi:hypothetical protein